MEEENKNVETDTVVKIDAFQETTNVQAEPVAVIETYNEIQPEVMPTPAEPVAVPEQIPATPEVVEPVQITSEVPETNPQPEPTIEPVATPTPTIQTTEPVTPVATPAPTVQTTEPVTPVATPAPAEVQVQPTEEPKKKSKLPIIILIIILLAAIGFAVWFFVLCGNGNKANSDKEDEQQQEEEKEEQPKEDEEIPTEVQPIDLEKCLNKMDDKSRYENITTEDAFGEKDGIVVTTGEKSYITIDWNLFSNLYGDEKKYYDGKVYSYEIKGIDEIIINHVLSGNGQAFGSEYVVFLTNKGNVYSVKLIKNQETPANFAYEDTENPNNSYFEATKIKDISKIVSIGIVDRFYGEGVSNKAIIAAKSDGSFYDLFNKGLN